VWLSSMGNVASSVGSKYCNHYNYKRSSVTDEGVWSILVSGRLRAEVV